MPISRERFDAAPDEDTIRAKAGERVFAFLAAHPDEAFTEAEIVMALEGRWPAPFPGIAAALFCAERLSQVKTNAVDGARYYMLGEAEDETEADDETEPQDTAETAETTDS